MSYALRILTSVCIGLVLIVVVGCGGTGDCGPVGVSVSPNTATADHTAAPPFNHQQLVAFSVFPDTKECAAFKTIILNKVTWSTSDPVDVSINNTQGPTDGIATCINAVSSPMTITATKPLPGGGTFTGTASLTCK